MWPIILCLSTRRNYTDLHWQAQFSQKHFPANKSNPSNYPLSVPVLSVQGSRYWTLFQLALDRTDQYHGWHAQPVTKYSTSPCFQIMKRNQQPLKLFPLYQHQGYSDRINTSQGHKEWRKRSLESGSEYTTQISLISLIKCHPISWQISGFVSWLDGGKNDCCSR